MTEAERDIILLGVARKHLDLTTLRTQGQDNRDFHDQAVWDIKDALVAAFEAGQEVEPDRTPPAAWPTRETAAMARLVGGDGAAHAALQTCLGAIEEDAPFDGRAAAITAQRLTYAAWLEDEFGSFPGVDWHAIALADIPD